MSVFEPIFSVLVVKLVGIISFTPSCTRAGGAGAETSFVGSARDRGNMSHRRLAMGSSSRLRAEFRVHHRRCDKFPRKVQEIRAN